MPIRQLEVHRFTAFVDATFDLAPGVNVLVGPNGSGKSHVLKLLYVLYEAARRHWEPHPTPLGFDAHVGAMLGEVFLPDHLGRLVRRTQKGRKTAEVTLSFGAAEARFTLTQHGRVTADASDDPIADDVRHTHPAVFLPTREMLSIYPGFVSHWEERQTTWDRTYYDLCLLLGKSALRGPRDAARKRLLDPLEAALGGETYAANGRFYVKLPDGDLAMPLLAEGMRKLAQLAWLILNGSLRDRSVLLWDEPEANMNPEHAPLLASTVVGLARQGVQVVLATHDYVFASELSRQIEVERRGGSPSIAARDAFFSIRRAEGGGRQVERTEAFALLEHNPILDALAALHDRELSPAAEAPLP